MPKLRRFKTRSTERRREIFFFREQLRGDRKKQKNRIGRLFWDLEVDSETSFAVVHDVNTSSALLCREIGNAVALLAVITGDSTVAPNILGVLGVPTDQC